MSKELEAWKELENQYRGLISNTDIPKLREDEKQRLKIIETALKRLEEYENTKFIAIDSLELQNKEWLKDFFEKPSPIFADATPLEIKPIYSEQDAKKLKALEIIKEKSVDVGFLQWHSSVDSYNSYIVEHAWTKHTKTLTQEEYDLLREVFL